MESFLPAVLAPPIDLPDSSYKHTFLHGNLLSEAV